LRRATEVRQQALYLLNAVHAMQHHWWHQMLREDQREEMRRKMPPEFLAKMDNLDA
jgi:hypothetical protein